MFLISSTRPIDRELEKIVAEIEQSPSLSVLAARQFSYSLDQTSIEVSISQSRKFNVIEEFIFRAGVEINPPPTDEELATVLGLDPIFTRNIADNLRALSILEADPESKIKLTTIGERLYKCDVLPDESQELRKAEVYALFDPLNNDYVLLETPLETAKIEELEDISEFVKIRNRSSAIFDPSLLEFQELLDKSNLTLHCPSDGKIVTNLQVKTTEAIHRSLSITVVFDTLDKQIKLEARNGEDSLSLEGASRHLNILLDEKQISLNTLFELTDDKIECFCQEASQYKSAEVEARIEIVRQKALEGYNQNQSSTEIVHHDAGTAVQLRGAVISQELEHILNSANQEVLIYSPWVNATIVDSRFINRLQKLADNGVWILIGHGIAKTQLEQERPISPVAEARLRSILTPEGIPAVQVFWLGGSHAKEIIADRQVHLLGSNNLLSFRASSGTWDESVYKVTIPGEVEKAHEFYSQRFQAKAEELWNQSVQNQELELAKSIICLWGSLGMESLALDRLQENNWVTELYDTWIKVVTQGIRSQRMLPDLGETILKKSSPLLKDRLEAISSFRSAAEIYKQQDRLDIYKSLMEILSQDEPVT